MNSKWHHGPGPGFRFPGRLSGTRLPVLVRFSGFLAGDPVYPASGPGPVFRLAGRPAGRLAAGWTFPIVPTMGCHIARALPKLFF